MSEYMYDIQGYVVPTRRNKHIEYFQDKTSPPPIIDMSQLTNINELMTGRRFVFQDERSKRYFQTGRFMMNGPVPILDVYLGSAEQMKNGQDPAAYTGFIDVVLDYRRYESVKLLMLGSNECLSVFANFVIKERGDGNKATYGVFWKIYRHTTTNKIYIQNSDTGLFMFSADNGFVGLDAVDSTNVQQYGAFRIVPVAGASPPPPLPQATSSEDARMSIIKSGPPQQNQMSMKPQPGMMPPKIGQEAPQMPMKQQPGMMPQVAQMPMKPQPGIMPQKVRQDVPMPVVTESTESDTASPPLMDVSASMVGMAYVFADPRNGNFFQAGRFDPGMAILDKNGDGYVQIVAADKGTVKLVLNGNEYISSDGTYATKTLSTTDPNATWRMYRHMKNNRIYFLNANTNKYMRVSDGNIIIMDSLNPKVIRFGGFIIMRSS